MNPSKTASSSEFWPTPKIMKYCPGSCSTVAALVYLKRVSKVSYQKIYLDLEIWRAHTPLCFSVCPYKGVRSTFLEMDVALVLQSCALVLTWSIKTCLDRYLPLEQDKYLSKKV